MSFNDPSLGAMLDAWLSYLDQAGFKIGVRERLQVQRLLVQLSVRGELVQHRSATEVLAFIRPLLCTKPEQQRQYASLLAQFTTQQRADDHSSDPNPANRNSPQTDPESRKFKRWHAVLLIGALVLLTIIALGIWNPFQPPIDPSKGGFSATNGDSAQSLPSPPLTPEPPPPELTFEFAQPSIPVAPAIPEWFSAARPTLLTVGGASLLMLLWLLWAHWRRQLYLQNTRTDREIEQFFLTDPNPVPLEPAPTIIRSAARLMRQPYAGQRTALDSLTTIRATLQAGGVLSLRYRLLKQTPEYLVLIDQRHPADHHAAYSDALIAALMQNGVAADVLYFEGAPQTGCWRMRTGAQGRERFGQTTFAELAARYAGHRLLMFAEALALVDEVTGLPRHWVTFLNAFPQRAWLTPMPLNAWSWAEQAADEQGFLVLPMQPESLATAAGWFSAGQLGLAVGADWPLNYPSLLRDNALAWVIQRNAPPDTVQEELLFQLRDYLGAQRFQWLCACSIFPAISPAMTLVLGREINADSRDLMLGMAAIGALPWFRHAFMPAWLRLQLVHRLNSTSEAHFRQIIEKRLIHAIDKGKGAPLLTLARHKRLLAAWLHRRRGPARDVVLVDFLHRGPLVRLAQRLPEVLRKRLFHQGMPAYGIAKGLLWLLPAGLLFGLLGWKGESILIDPVSAPPGDPAIPVTLVLIPSGSFNFGDPPGKSVQIAKPFYLGKYEVTYAQYDDYIQAQQQKGIQVKSPDTATGGRGNQPVVYVDYKDAVDYAAWLSERTKLSCRLPTEFEWEYAARAGTPTKYYWGGDVGKNNANCDGCGSRWDNQQAAPVGQFKANPWKLHDMSGNVWEWTCSDYSNDSQNNAPQQCASDSFARVVRGGSWGSNPDIVRSSVRYDYHPDFRLGFRVLCESPIE
ncbi:formylglycine-generating enzyme family protein [Nitrosomonas sp.]|uniref:formylglycine-generating enzyme family protein n=1 Tax=Nitrosomonas sp. TaxID=42353 RepID=UPI001E18DF27|nr:formylglycine-generating enzyme family protein [Nitrosomonas sp.]MBX3617329.1 formylglycine-generating enzyme family protein [Nitrosomonas sp.]